MSKTVLVNVSNFNNVEIIKSKGVTVLESRSICHDIMTDVGTFNTKINQYVIQKEVRGSTLTYTISIPHILYNGVELPMLTKLLPNTDIGLSNLIDTVIDNCDVIDTDNDYRNKLLLTSHRSLDMINVMVDRFFIDSLVNIKPVINDKVNLHRLITKSFVNEVIKYTNYHKLLDYSYTVNMRCDLFNMLNIFTYKDGGSTFLHISFNVKGNDVVSDKYIRGYNFLITE